MKKIVKFEDVTIWKNKCSATITKYACQDLLFRKEPSCIAFFKQPKVVIESVGEYFVTALFLHSVIFSYGKIFLINEHFRFFWLYVCSLDSPRWPNLGCFKKAEIYSILASKGGPRRTSDLRVCVVVNWAGDIYENSNFNTFKYKAQFHINVTWGSIINVTIAGQI